MLPRVSVATSDVDAVVLAGVAPRSPVTRVQPRFPGLQQGAGLRVARTDLRKERSPQGLTPASGGSGGTRSAVGLTGSTDLRCRRWNLLGDAVPGFLCRRLGSCGSCRRPLVPGSSVGSRSQVGPRSVYPRSAPGGCVGPGARGPVDATTPLAARSWWFLCPEGGSWLQAWWGHGWTWTRAPGSRAEDTPVSERLSFLRRSESFRFEFPTVQGPLCGSGAGHLPSA